MNDHDFGAEEPIVRLLKDSETFSQETITEPEALQLTDSVLCGVCVNSLQVFWAAPLNSAMERAEFIWHVRRK